MVRILIVDDHAIVRRGLKEILADDLGEVWCGEAADADNAYRQIASQLWDVIILDINLPTHSGLDVLHHIRHQSQPPPVLVLSMYPEDQYAMRALKAGASGYLTKESATDELSAAVRKVLHGGRYVSETMAEQLALQVGTEGVRALHEQLSDREYDVMRRLASGQTVSEIARELDLSVKTVSTYRTRTLEKLHLRNNAELMSYALRRELVL